MGGVGTKLGGVGGVRGCKISLSISLERLKLRTSNLVRRMITRSTTKNAKLGNKRDQGAWPLLSRDVHFNFGNPSISL